MDSLNVLCMDTHVFKPHAMCMDASIVRFSHAWKLNGCMIVCIVLVEI